MSELRVAIVGAGIVGLTTAVALRKYIGDEVKLDIQIYEKLDIGDMAYPDGRRNDPTADKPNLGSAIVLQGNGLRSLAQIDPSIEAAVLEDGLLCKSIRIKTSNECTLGVLKKDCVVISRGNLLKAIRRLVPRSKINHKGVAKVSNENGKAMLLLEGEHIPLMFDLIIGADGIRSPTRTALFGDSKKYQPQYSGFCAVGGFHEMPVPEYLIKNPALTFTWGSTGFFGYALSKPGSGKMIYWSVYDHPLPPKDHTIDPDTMGQTLRARHGRWKSPIIQNIVGSAKVDSMWPIFFVPRLPHWGRDGVVIMGDAAHAMTPQSGQGSSQGIEDAQTLAILLRDELKNQVRRDHLVGCAVRKSIDALYYLRQDRVWGIHQQASRLAQPKLPISQWNKYIVYAFLYVFVRLVPWLADTDDWPAEEIVGGYCLDCISSAYG